MKESRIQKFVGLFVSKRKKEVIKQESNRWGFVCASCGQRTGIWDAGGIRYKAKGNPSVYMKCPKCGKGAMQEINYT